MTRGGRLAVFAAGAAALAVLLAVALAGLPSFGSFHGVYGTLVGPVVVAERHATGVVSAITFDVRGFDTLGEEFMLFAAVIGVLAILRVVGPGERRSDEDDEGAPSNAARAVGLALVGPTVVVGLYVVAHGALTPGGGFQGGVLISSAVLLVFVAGSAVALRRLSPVAFVEWLEAAGAAGFALIAIGGLIFASAFFEDFLGAGTVGSLLSGGIIPVASLAVGCEVTGGLILIVSEFLEQDLLRSGGDR
jgi:multicomponent Na+:H+ antiporter subunit B